MSRSRSWLTPPVFDDMELTHRARLLHLLVWSTIFAATAWQIIQCFVFPSLFSDRMEILGPVLACCALLLGLNRTGRTRLAGWLLVCVIWFTIMAIAPSAGGIRAPGVTAFICVVLIAAMLLGEAAAMGVAGLCALGGLGLVMAEFKHLLPVHPEAFSPISIWINNTLSLGFVLALHRLGLKSTRDALDMAESELAERQRVEGELTATEAALRNSEKEFRTVFENAAMGIATLDLNGRVIRCNRAMEEFFGRNQDEMRVVKPATISDPRDVEVGKEQFRALIAGRRDSAQFDKRYLNRNGKTKWGSVTLSLIRLPDRNPGFIVALVEDVTRRHESEEEVRKTNSRLHAALKGGGMGTWIWDIKKATSWWDESLIKLFGIAPKDINEGNPDTFVSLLHPDDRERVAAALAAVVRDGSDYDVEYRIIKPEGALLWIDARGHLEKDAQGEPLYMTGACVDITARKKAEEEHARLETQLRQSQKMQALGTLAGGIAHDFNNILTAVMGNAELASESIEPNHAAFKNIMEVRQASVRAKDLVRRILMFSRQQESNRKVVHLQSIVEEALKLLRASLPSRIEIRPRFAENLPPVCADATQVHQIVMNLGTNAGHAMGEGAGRLDVVLEPILVDASFVSLYPDLKENRYIRLTVSDSGCGMNKETLERIFEPFFTTKPAGVGTGLGLSVVHGIMKEHEGAITVYSEPGKGTAFYLYFPAIEGAAEAVEAETKPVPTGNGERILYVDDEESLVLLMNRTLTRLKYEVTGCTDPFQALQMFTSHPDAFDAVVTDLSMPGLTGTDLVQEMRRIRPDVPIIIASGFLRPEDIMTARRLGIDEVILKPNTMQEIGEALQRLLAVRKSASKPAHSLS